MTLRNVHIHAQPHYHPAQKHSVMNALVHWAISLYEANNLFVQSDLVRKSILSIG